MKLISGKAINRYILTAISVIGILIILIFKVPSYIEYKNLEKLGYDNKTIEIIRTKKLASYILKNQLFSEYLKQELPKDNFNSNYIKLYTVNNNINEFSFKIYDSLIKKGYNEKQSLKLFENLKNFELTALLTFDLQDDTGIDNYIQDCLSHPENNESKFKLTNNYKSENIKEHDFSIDILVNYNNAIKKDATINLVSMGLNYATEGLKAQEEAYRHFTVMIDYMNTKKLEIYAIEAYRGFETQQQYYDSVKKPDSQGISKPGHSDFNTGLAFQIVSKNGGSFKSSPEFQWLKDNASKYGFIIRYPEGKEYITGKDEYSNIIRYVGVEIAEIMKAQNLSFEEYHALYK